MAGLSVSPLLQQQRTNFNLYACTALESNNFYLRFDAARALAMVGNPVGLDVLKEALTVGDNRQQLQAIKVSSFLPEIAALQVLSLALNGSPELRIPAIQKLGEIKGDSAQSLLLKLYSQNLPSSEFREVSFALGANGGRSAVEALSKSFVALTGSKIDKSVLSKIAVLSFSLLQLKEEHYLYLKEVLSPLLNNQSPFIVLGVASVLAKGNNEMIEIIEALLTSDPYLEFDASELLKHIKTKAAETLLGIVNKSIGIEPVEEKLFTDEQIIKMLTGNSTEDKIRAANILVELIRKGKPIDSRMIKELKQMAETGSESWSEPACHSANAARRAAFRALSELGEWDFLEGKITALNKAHTQLALFAMARLLHNEEAEFISSDILQ
ncbi:MAG: hypothetical protein FD145_1296 [Candidatus Saganbacteria bacterium]|uniref:HEAT repeat domain-containing protein n=1 Tax=Candidatus Saganbacteria bacterium TaxID=2575572 RepID=A0A833P2U6_UNCSA|nr:MAG: hypothetical protein FD145_1296 [Candidatus Saganbacteria bacterium]